MRILVAYATGTGSTAEVAAAIADVLRADGAPVDLTHVRDVESLDPYGGVVIGSSVRAGRWLPDGIRFVEAHAATLTERNVAFFTTCLTMVEDTEENRRTVLAYMAPVMSLAPDVDPVGLGLFAGSLSPNIRLIMPGPGPYGDFRDWEAIRDWAAEIRPLLLDEQRRARAQPVLRGAVMSFSDLSGSSLQGLDLRGAELRKTSFGGADMRGADLRRSDLSGADLRRAALIGAQLGWAEINQGDLRDADLREANLVGAELRQADLRHADLEHAVLNGANMAGANLAGARLRRADLNWVVLAGADLSDADLAMASLGWADLTGAKLARTDLSKARYNEQTKWPADFEPETAGCILVKGPY